MVEDENDKDKDRERKAQDQIPDFVEYFQVLKLCAKTELF